MAKLTEEEKKLLREIYWIFRNKIHNGHTQISSEEGVIKSCIKIEDTSCYVCKILHETETEIAKLFPDNLYYKTEKIEKISNKEEVIRCVDGK